MAQSFEAAVVTQGFTDMKPSQTNTGKARIPDSVLTSVNGKGIDPEGKSGAQVACGSETRRDGYSHITLD